MQRTIGLPEGDPLELFASLRERLPGPAMLFERGSTAAVRGAMMTFGCTGELIARDGSIAVSAGGVDVRFTRAQVLSACRALMDRCRPAEPCGSSAAGAYGVAAFECANYFERLPELPKSMDSILDLHLVVPRLVVEADRQSRTARLLSLDGAKPLGEAEDALALVGRSTIHACAPTRLVPMAGSLSFAQMVARAKQAIAEGDVFQVVLSQGWSGASDADPLAVYRHLRRINPSPYLFFMELPEATLIGASPEMLCSLRDGVARVRPLAGTRARPRLRAMEPLVSLGLRNDPKERAEHVMLVDLARNDLGSVCEYGSVQVTEFMGVERFSHVLHLVSDVRGRLRRDRDAFDLFAATFPAGTVSGAPKIRAMELIAELEGRRRGPYGGAVLNVGFDGSMEASIVLRSAVFAGRQVLVRAGAGIVADSVAAREDAECRAKARAVVGALSSGRGVAF